MARLLGLLPALVLAQLGLWICSLARTGTVGIAPLTVAATALGNDVLALARALPMLVLLSWPLLTLRSPRLRLLAVGLLWSLFLLAQGALEQYFLVARTPLGADLFGYSWAEIRTTLADGADLRASTVLGMIAPLLVLWLGLAWRARRPPPAAGGPLVLLLIMGFAAWWLPLAPGVARLPNDAARDIAINKTAYFVADSLRLWRPSAASIAPAVASAAGRADVRRAFDPAHPFLHPDDTPDVLGPYFGPTNDGKPPNIVLIIVEGLGRSFSGPDAHLGSFTPFLDELAGRSLYFDNFLANQGRTFGVLPALLGSLPVAEHGFLDLGARMPAHPGLFNVLQRQGYASAFYNGTDTSFDNERTYLQRQGVGKVIDLQDFGSGYARNPFSAWGYPDRELVSRVLADSSHLQQPFMLAMQTISMHTSYRFPGQGAYQARVVQRLDALDVAPGRRQAYLDDTDIYTTILYTDDQLRRYFEAVAQAPWYANTIFVITGDHRLPEIQMDSHVERYHVPLIMFSPLLREPRRIGAVSSHVDVTPSLLALLSHTYGVRRPALAAWTGSGLDMATAFGNRHDIVLQQTKTSALDFIAGNWLLHAGQLFELGNGMQASPITDAAVQAQLEQRLARYQTANAAFLRTLILTPEGANPKLVAYATTPSMTTAAAAPIAASGLGLEAVQVVAKTGVIAVAATFANGDAAMSNMFVPLVVLADANGHQLKEGAGLAQQLGAHASREVHLALDSSGLRPGRYFVSVLPSDPNSGKAVGHGRFHIPFELDAGP